MDRDQSFIEALRQLIAANGGGGDAPMGQQVRGLANPLVNPMGNPVVDLDPLATGWTLPNGNINMFGQGLANAPGQNKPEGSKSATPTKKPAKKPAATPTKPTKPTTPTPPMGKPQR